MDVLHKVQVQALRTPFLPALHTGPLPLMAKAMGSPFTTQQETAIFIAIAGTQARNVTYTMCLYPRALKTRYDSYLSVLLHASIISYGPIILQGYLVY